jgi:3-methyl-2-oxobutanoate hydroxymethyltransferase
MPAIGIGAGRYTDGQVLVTTDVLGLDPREMTPRKQYADLDGVIEDAVSEYVGEVENGAFPAREHVSDPVEE